MSVCPVDSTRVGLYYFHFQKEKAVFGNEKLMSRQPADKRSSLFMVPASSLCGVSENYFGGHCCGLVIQSTPISSTFVEIPWFYSEEGVGKS